jgi:malonyl-CoA decarboxylase
MSLLADLLSTVFERATKPLAQQADSGAPLDEMMRDLVRNHDEVQGMVLAQQILNRYHAMEDADKKAFFLMLAQDMDIQPDQVRAALDAYEEERTKATYRAFVEAAEAPRQEMLRRLNQIPGATGQLVAMRADLLKLVRAHPELAPVDLDFRHLFASWFNRGFLVLRPVNWDSPAQILEKIIAYEAVHAIDSWDDLRARLQPSDRRCFAFFHPSMPNEPLIFVEVALTRGVPNTIHSVLTEDRTELPPQEADTAVFYSISNCQAGLASISFGNSLIKQVAGDLARDLPGLKTFVTLSPIPGLATWMETVDRNELDPDAEVDEIAADFLLNAKRLDGMPIDPVARFHLGNGAMVHAVHAKADLSPKGQAQSKGAMVNYLYDLSKIAENVQVFATQGQVVASSAVKAQARNATRKKR